MSNHDPNDWQALIHDLLGCEPDHLAQWIAVHRANLDLMFLQALKGYTDDQRMRSDAHLADKATGYALQIAEALSEESLAYPLACWARGNCLLFVNPKEAIRFYRLALTGYQAIDDGLSVARLQSNLVGVLMECGHFDEAEAAYQAAHVGYRNCAVNEPFYLVRLEQNYGLLLHYQGRYEEAMQAHQRAIQLSEKAGMLIVTAEILVNQAWTSGLLGEINATENALLTARHVAVEHKQALTLARIDLDLGILYTALGQPASALRNFQKAHTGFAALGNEMELASVAMYEGALFQRIGSWRAARQHYAQAQTLFTLHQMWPQVAQTFVQQAVVNRLAGDYAKSCLLLQEANLLCEKLGNQHWLTLVRLEQVALDLAQNQYVSALTRLQKPLPIADHSGLNAQHDFFLAESLRQQGQTANEIEPVYLRALDVARHQEDYWLQRQILAGVGRLLLLTEPRRAQLFLEEAVALDARIRQSLSVEELKAGFQEQSNELLPMLAALAIGQQEPLCALGYLWQAKGNAFLELQQALHLKTNLTAEGQAEFAQLRQAIASRRWVLTTQARINEPDSLRESQDAKLQALEQELNKLRRHRNQEIDPASAVSSHQLHRWLNQMEADLLFEYGICNDQLLGIVVNRAGAVYATWLADIQSVGDLLDEVQLDFQNIVSQSPEQLRRHGGQWQQESRHLLQRCYELLVAPLLQGIAQATANQSNTLQRLLIAPCYPLFLLPFAALWDGANYLVERFVIEFIPSGALLSLPPTTTEKLTTPWVITTSAAGALAATYREAEAILTAFPTAVAFVDRSGAVEALMQLSDSPRFLHIAAHTILRNDAPLFSALQLTGEVLTVEECYELKLVGTELVILSGCSTAVGMESGGGLLAFQSALLAAGAQRVLTSQWPIQDDATAHWMTHFYQYFAQKQPAPMALRQTQMLLLHDPLFSHPAHWAAFVCTCR